MTSLWDPNAIVQGLWQGVFQLVALAVVAAFGTFIYQRRQSRYALREQLIDSINQFAVSLYKPRKLYQTITDQTCDPWANLADPAHREVRRLEAIYQSLEDVVAATGQFRVLQIRLIALYGHDPEVFGYYLAIWRHLKEMRDRMVRSEKLYSHPERQDAPDALYLLIDAFRYRIMLRPLVRRPPGLAAPTAAVLAELRRRGDEIYAAFLSEAEQGRPSVVASPWLSSVGGSP